MDLRRLSQSDIAEHDRPSWLVIEGPIGVGKTTLTKRLAQSLGYETLFEQAESNPFLARFYAGEANSALATQLFFLLQRCQQLQTIHQQDLFAAKRVSDYLIDKDRLFAEVTLDADELKLYYQVFDHLTLNTPQPDLVVYLQAPSDVLLRRIAHRGIRAEQTISADYLDKLNQAYSRFFHFYEEAPLLIVNAADIDWVNDASSYDALLKYILTIKRGRHYYNPQPSF
jgi:deoxyguanosine kinase